MTDPRRRFSGRERVALALGADGKCQRCGEPLEPSWHADHVQPHSRGGRTELSNGQALCASCNLLKGASVDRIELRPFQEQLTAVALARIAAGEAVTVGWVSAGSGKTLGWMHLANELYRAGLIDGVVVLVPRLTLRTQAELDWWNGKRGDAAKGFRTLYAGTVMGKIVGRPNQAPLTKADEFGYVTCYDSVRSYPELHAAWAQAHQDRFLLVTDEAQFLGTANETGGGTVAAEKVEQLAGLALHTVLLTGTPLRSDGRQIVLTKYSDPDESGVRHLQWHVRATYRQGLASGYLRPFQFNLHGGEGSFSDGQDFTIDAIESRLRKIVLDPRIWEPLADSVAEELLIRQRLSMRYRALISGENQDHAQEIYEYLVRRYPNLRIRLAVSRDGSDAQDVLRHFRPAETGGTDDGDILVTKSMAYIGYDCPSITVVGNLSSTRWRGWLDQFAARGSRMWKERPVEEQTCIYIGPVDPKHVEFVVKMRADVEDGLRERGTRDGGEGPPPDSDGATVVDARLTDERAYNSTEELDLSPEELAGLREVRLRMEHPISETVLADALRAAGRDIPRAKPKERAADENAEERRRRWGRDCRSALTSYLAVAQGLRSRERPEEFRREMARAQARLNDIQSVPDVNHLTDEQWAHRLRVIETWTAGAR